MADGAGDHVAAAKSSGTTLDEGRLLLALRAFTAAPSDRDTPQLLLSQAVAATGAMGGVVACPQHERVEVLASQGYTPAQTRSCGSLRADDLSLPLTYTLATGEPVWIESHAETIRRFPRLVELTPREERAYAVLPLRVGGELLGASAVSFDQPHTFSDVDREILLALADLCSLHLQQWRRRSSGAGAEGATASLGRLVRALVQADTSEDVARAIAEEGADATGAAFSNIAIVDPGSAPASAWLYHLSSLVEDVAQRYPAIPIDGSTSLGQAIATGGEVWLRNLTELGAQYPALYDDTVASGLAATASLALRGRGGRVIGALGLGWPCAQEFGERQRDDLRVVAQLAADALGRTQLLEAERAGRQRAEGLQQIMSVLVASASLTDVVSAVFQGGVAPYGASAARLSLVDERQPGSLITVGSVGVPESQQSWLSIPLHSGSHTLGVLTLGMSERHALDQAADHISLAALASSIADAISRALEHDSDRDMVALVQRSLLTDELPDLPGVRLGAMYLPAETRYGIGGDWYDAVPLDGGRTLLMVGDVAGHGVDAALSMGLMRSAARALAPTHQPAALLHALDTYIINRPDQPMATAAAVLVDPVRMTLTYSLAGHPPPLLRARDGRITYLEEAVGMPLGVLDQPRPQQTIDIAEGSVLLLYTDGLVETRTEMIDEGIARLARALARSCVDDPGGMCAVLVQECMRGAARSDDTALVCAQIVRREADRSSALVR